MSNNEGKAFGDASILRSMCFKVWSSYKEFADINGLSWPEFICDDDSKSIAFIYRNILLLYFLRSDFFKNIKRCAINTENNMKRMEMWPHEMYTYMRNLQQNDQIKYAEEWTKFIGTARSEEIKVYIYRIIPVIDDKIIWSAEVETQPRQPVYTFDSNEQLSENSSSEEDNEEEQRFADKREEQFILDEERKYREYIEGRNIDMGKYGKGINNNEMHHEVEISYKFFLILGYSMTHEKIAERPSEAYIVMASGENTPEIMRLPTLKEYNSLITYNSIYSARLFLNENVGRLTEKEEIGFW